VRRNRPRTELQGLCRGRLDRPNDGFLRGNGIEVATKVAGAGRWVSIVKLERSSTCLACSRLDVVRRLAVRQRAAPKLTPN
jgi:hypothetical protein